MSNDDIAISPVGLVNKVVTSNKPSYLVMLEELVKGKPVVKNFITLDRPDTEAAYVKVKGFYTDAGEEEVIENYQGLLTNASRDVIVEMMIPWVRIHKIRSLVFKAK